MWWSVALCVIALVVVKLSHWFYKWSNPKCNGKLPPGSMGFPIIGESLEFFEPHGFYEVLPFIKRRTLRHGPLFRTSILGSNTIVSTDPEVNFEILRQENKSFVISYPDGFTRIFGKDNIFLKQGNFHKYIRQMSQILLGPDSLKRRMIHEMDRMTREHLRLTAREGVLDVKDAVASLIMEYITPAIISDIEPETKRRLIENCRAFSWDFFKSPFNLSSWQALYKIVAARKTAINMLKDMIARRKASKESRGDFLDTMLEEIEKQGTILTEDRAIDLIFTILLLTHESTGTATPLAVKFVSENPKVLAELKREHQTILRNRADKESGVTWEEYRSMMNFTHMVINESLRLATIGPIMFRKAVNDVDVKGYTIPADWIVLVAPAVAHYDHEIYDKPCEFNPWRWEGKELLSGSKTFMAFGGGARLCAGAEFARLQMAIFLHHLVTEYNFSSTGKGNIARVPLLRFSEAIRINISKSCNE